ncbi:MAG: hypothetical protein ACYDHZ_12015 [Dehalococcoidia bacterium]
MTIWLNVKNNAESTLASGITSVATSLTVAAGEGVKFPGSNFNITIDGEILLCTSRTGDVLTVTRAQEGTAAAVHAAATVVSLNVTAGIVSQLQTALNNLFLAPLSGEAFRLQYATADSPFAAKINGAPTGTLLYYNNDTGEGSLAGLQAGADYWGRIMLYNSTRGTYRKIVSVDTANNYIVTENCADAWAGGDNITTQSQVNTAAGFFDVDLSACIPADAVAAALYLYSLDNSAAANPNRALIIHPYCAYDLGKRILNSYNVANQPSNFYCVLPIYSRKITVYLRSVSNALDFISVKGYM